MGDNYLAPSKNLDRVTENGQGAYVQSDEKNAKDFYSKAKALLNFRFPDLVFTNDEIFFLASALYERGLSAFSNDFYVYPFRNNKTGESKNQIVFSIESFRKIARRSCNYGISIKAVFDDGTVADLPLPNKNLIGAKAIVTINGVKSEKSVLLSEFDTGKNLWVTKKFVMISKVAEATVLRVAFPENLQGFYVAEEFDKVADKGQGQIPTKIGEETLETKISKRLAELGLNPDNVTKQEATKVKELLCKINNVDFKVKEDLERLYDTIMTQESGIIIKELIKEVISERSKQPA